MTEENQETYLITLLLAINLTWTGLGSKSVPRVDSDYQREPRHTKHIHKPTRRQKPVSSNVPPP